MVEATLPLPAESWVTVPAPAQAALLALVATLQSENAALQERIRDLEARLGQDSSNSSRPPSADLPQAAAKRKQQSVPSGRKRGAQPGHAGRFRSLLSVEEVDEVVVVVPEQCHRCQQPFPNAKARRRMRV